MLTVFLFSIFLLKSRVSFFFVGQHWSHLHLETAQYNHSLTATEKLHCNSRGSEGGARAALSLSPPQILGRESDLPALSLLL